MPRWRHASEFGGHDDVKVVCATPPAGAADRFYAVRAGGLASSSAYGGGWRSDVCWLSVDDAATHETTNSVGARGCESEDSQRIDAE